MIGVRVMLSQLYRDRCVAYSVIRCSIQISATLMKTRYRPVWPTWFKLSSRIERVFSSLGRQFAGQWSLWERTDGAQNF